MEEELGIPLPEMVFGSNILEVKHEPSQLTLQFKPEPALDDVDKTLGGKTKVLQVANSAKWKASKIKNKKEQPPQLGQLDYDVDRVHRPFDWTYTSSYEGEASCPKEPTAKFEPSEKSIPYDVLRKPDPILFFDEVPLYEDELGDFGLCAYSVKIRVMPHNLFILARFYMRVDNVAFRIRDTRVYVDFKTDEIIKEHQEKEGSFEFVRSKVPIWQDDYTQLFRDPNWVDSVLPVDIKTISALKPPQPLS